MPTLSRWIVVMSAAVLPTATLQAQEPPEHAADRSYNLALGAECTHCHVEGQPADASKPTFDFARRMAQMVQGINDGPLQALGGVSCWTCHRGQPLPARIPRTAWEPFTRTHAAAFAGGRENLALTMGVCAGSLGVDCAHCHLPGNWTDDSKPASRTVSTMLQIFDVIPKYFDASVRAPQTQCYMCHQGSTRVPRVRP